MAAISAVCSLMPCTVTRCSMQLERALIRFSQRCRHSSAMATLCTSRWGARAAVIAVTLFMAISSIPLFGCAGSGWSGGSLCGLSRYQLAQAWYQRNAHRRIGDIAGGNGVGDLNTHLAAPTAIFVTALDDRFAVDRRQALAFTDTGIHPAVRAGQAMFVVVRWVVRVQINLSLRDRGRARAR